MEADNSGFEAHWETGIFNGSQHVDQNSRDIPVLTVQKTAIDTSGSVQDATVIPCETRQVHQDKTSVVLSVISSSQVKKDDSLLSGEQHLFQNQRYGTNASGVSHAKESARLRAERLVSSESQGNTVLTFHDIKYEVDVKTRPCCGGTSKKQILKGINGIFKPGMNAILGPTGSGKSSLLDILAGRKDPKGLDGNILLDGLPPPQNFKCLVGYVVQDDVVMGTLSVRENFEFSAALRLPQSVTREERKRRVDQVISELGLSEVADSKVGNEFIRGVSGGERKRCNIGMELIISPPVLFLDEPTTGLDASTANAVMLLLKGLSKRGRNIIFSIHQPRYSIYRLFDSLMLLSHGETAYHGPAMEALEYFKTLGYECEEHNNPPDFFLDVINGDSTAVSAGANALDREDDESQEESKTANGGMKLTDTSNDARSPTDHAVNINVTESLADQYRKSNWCKSVTNELTSVYENYERELDSGTLVEPKKIEYKTSFFTQLGVVSGRCIKNIARNPQVSTMQFGVIAIFAVVVGGVYFKTSSSVTSGIQNRTGAFFFIIMNQVFGNMSAVELFIKERAIFIHENVGGFYRVSAFFLAKVFCDVIPMRMIPAVIFSAIVYYMIDLRGGVDHFFFFTLTLFLTALSASALSFAISSTVKIFAIANLCLALCYVFMMLFSGLLVNLEDLGDWISWLRYLSIFRFSLNALSINELKDAAFCNGTICAYGNEYLEAQGIPYETEWDKWQNNMALACMTFGFMVLAYIQLRRIQKLK